MISSEVEVDVDVEVGSSVARCLPLDFSESGDVDGRVEDVLRAFNLLLP